MMAPEIEQASQDRKRSGGKWPTCHKTPGMRCPVCDSRGNVRSSHEVTPLTREIRVRCSNDDCGMIWNALISFKSVVTPSALGDHFRHSKPDGEEPPGREFGQMPMFEKVNKADD